MSLTNETFTEQGNTLSTTLLPYVNQCSDFNFTSRKHDSVLNEFLKALTQHIKDTDGDVEKGFMILALKVNPQLLHEIVGCGHNSKVLLQTFVALGFSEQSARSIQSCPSKFLWLELLKFFEGKPQAIVDDCVKILSKLDIFEDPGSQMNSLLDIFGQRRLIVDLLLQVDQLDLNLSKLLLVLEPLRSMKSETIQTILKQ